MTATLRLVDTLLEPPAEDDQAWREDAACHGMDPELFFPDKGDGIKAPLKVCNQCPVRVECGEHALATRERYGVWGGLSERKRRKIRKLRLEGITVVLT